MGLIWENFALVGVLANKKRWNECLVLDGRSAGAVGEDANCGKKLGGLSWG
jgi:hypothetical protein